MLGAATELNCALVPLLVLFAVSPVLCATTQQPAPLLGQMASSMRSLLGSALLVAAARLVVGPHCAAARNVLQAQTKHRATTTSLRNQVSSGGRCAADISLTTATPPASGPSL